MAKKKDAKKDKGLFHKKRNIWTDASDADVKRIFDFAEGYKRVISKNKTEREMVVWGVSELRKAGFRELSKAGKLRPGDRVFHSHRGRALFAAVVGSAKLADGVNIVAAHVDSPRLDLKATPLSEDSETNTLQLETHYYGGIKKYQWLNVPLALHGVVVKGDGKSVEICIGEDPDDPVFIIGDLLIHLARRQADKKLFEAYSGEDLNIIAAHMPAKGDADKPIKLRVLQMLNDRYGIVEEDLVSADIQAVPAGPARDMGFDKGLVLSYGQDDRACAITALRAIVEIKKPKRTAIVAFYDKEEVGSGGNTGAQSAVLETFLAELMERVDGNAPYSALRRCIDATKVLSGDVDAGMHPNHKDVHEYLNAARLGHGIVLAKFSGVGGKSGGAEAPAEYLAEIRNLFNAKKVCWQNAELGKVDEGGGGTVARFLGSLNMEVLDCGPALLSMHAPYEISSKADIYHTYLAYKAFME